MPLSRYTSATALNINVNGEHDFEGDFEDGGVSDNEDDYKDGFIVDFEDESEDDFEDGFDDVLKMILKMNLTTIVQGVCNCNTGKIECQGRPAGGGGNCLHHFCHQHCHHHICHQHCHHLSDQNYHHYHLFHHHVSSH